MSFHPSSALDEALNTAMLEHSRRRKKGVILEEQQNHPSRRGWKKFCYPSGKKEKRNDQVKSKQPVDSVPTWSVLITSSKTVTPTLTLQALSSSKEPLSSTSRHPTNTPAYLQLTPLELWHRRLGHISLKFSPSVSSPRLTALNSAAVAEAKLYRMSLHAKENICSKEFKERLNALGIKQQRTAANAPLQKGVAERKNSVLMEAARCMIQQAKLGDQFWAEESSNGKLHKEPCGHLRA
ncbi:Retrovirus-related pol polyprotein from transposon tnt 1-94 [Balamuthia mandrillaris]